MKKLTDISSLIQLLDDPDELVYSHVKIQIMSIGEGAIPNLEEAWESNLFGVLFQNRIEELIHEIQFDAVAKSLNEWAHAKGASLLDGVMIINRYQYPDFDQEKMLKTLEQIQQDIWLELNTNLTAFEQVKVINHILFQIYGFSGNTLDYHSPKNSFLSEVLETKKGNPLSLSLIYSIISQNLDLPIYGVNLPHHFILAYLDRFSLYKTNNIFETDVLFYVNPFSKGTVFSKKEIDYFLEQLKLDPEDSFFKPATNVSIIRRALSNLENSYTKLGNDDRVKEIKHLISQLED
ncbi:transglutaminase-like domain-containing protein [Salibacteraceae bacterium]|nr:transglutaminase-like domain-containing protein [Salibacteraceae bacterium]MDB4105455.1 transglutaminase-like domain-containing protein [Salibacteraceae bacterium]MDB9708555.1 transglutaminase-like domain-containing protein [Salibacteraceae bacterium]MDC1305191.1 transglutaminase-like domain-containing protein [Salibacteraceae bacterium]